MEHYTAVVYATGAQTDKSLGIPGEDLPGSWAATEFVAWYNGHPDYRDREFDLSGKRAVVIGNGNVAADVTRMLTRSVDELAAHRRRRPRARGAARTARSRRSSCSAGAGPRRPRSRAPSCASSGTWTASTSASTPFELDPRQRGVARRRGHVHRAQERGAAARVRRPPARRRAAPDRSALPALTGRDPRDRPGRGDRDRAATRSCATTAARCGPGRSTSRSRRSSAGLVLRSVGYRAVPLPDVPVRRARATSCRTIEGRVLGARRRGAPRRLRRRLDQARADRDPRHQQARRRGDDRLPRRGPARRSRSRPAAPIDDLLAERKPDVVTADGWHAIDAAERERGRGAERPRVKLASRDELLAAARP